MCNRDLEQITADIISVVSRKSGVKPATITLSTRLLHDLHIYGDDAEEVLSEIGRTYQIDFSGFDFQQYFFPEGFAFWIIPSFLKRRLLSKKCPITIQELVWAAEAKKWDPAEKGSR